MFPRNARSPTCEVSPTWLPKYDLNKEDSNRHANKEGEAYEASSLEKEYIMKAGRVHQLVIQCQMVILENVCKEHCMD